MKTIAVAALLALFLTACGSDPTAPPPADSPRASATLDAAGGELSAVEGALHARLSIPTDALRAATDVVLEIVEPTAGGLGAIQLQPIGTRLARPMVLTITLEGAPADVGFAIGDPAAPTFLPTTRDGDRFTTQLPAFGFVEDQTTELAKDSSNAGTVQIVPTSCSVLIDAAEKARDELLDAVRPMLAAQALASTSAVLSDIGCESEAQSFLAETQTLVCDAYRGAVENAEVILIDDFGQFRALLEPVVSYEAVLQLLGANCQATPAEDVIRAKATELGEFYEPEATALQGEDYARFLQLYREIFDLYEIIANSELLGADLTQLLTETALLRVRNLARDAAYRTVRDGAGHYFLARLTEAGLILPRRIVEAKAVGDSTYSDDDLFADIQYVRTHVMVESRDRDGAILTEAFVGGKESPGRQVTAVNLEWDPLGTVRLDSTLAGLSCWRDDPAGDELIVEFEGAEILRRSVPQSGNVLETPIDLVVANVAQQAGVALSPGGSYTILLKRTRPDCAECECFTTLFGPAEYELARITLGESTTREVQFEDVQLQVSVLDGSASAGDESFDVGRTTVAAAAGSASVEGSLSISGDEETGISVNARADFSLPTSSNGYAGIFFNAFFELPFEMEFGLSAQLDGAARSSPISTAHVSFDGGNGTEDVFYVLEHDPTSGDLEGGPTSGTLPAGRYRIQIDIDAPEIPRELTGPMSGGASLTIQMSPTGNS